MTATSIGTILLTSQVAFGGLFSCNLFSKGSHCGPCRTSHPAVHREVSVLLHCPNWNDRKSAAQVLRKVDWKCHPEVVPALAHALLHDCEKKVRAEAAETLAKLAPCVPEAHSALVLASQRDPYHSTRKWANKGLGNLNRRCLASCTHCGPLPGTHVTVVQPLPVLDVVPAPPVYAPDPVPGLAPMEVLPPGNHGLPPVPDPSRSTLRPIYPEDSAIEAAPGLEPLPPDPYLPRAIPSEPPSEFLPPGPGDDSPFIVPPEASHRPAAPSRPQPQPNASPNRTRFTTILNPLNRR